MLPMLKVESFVRMSVRPIPSPLNIFPKKNFSDHKESGKIFLLKWWPKRALKQGMIYITQSSEWTGSDI